MSLPASRGYKPGNTSNSAIPLSATHPVTPFQTRRTTPSDGLELVDDALADIPSLGHPSPIAFESLSDAIKRELPQRDDLVPHLIPRAETLAFVHSPDTETSMLMMMLEYSITAKKPFPPFGKCAGVTVAHCSASGDRGEDDLRLRLIRNRDRGPLSRKRASEMLFRFYRDDLNVEQRHFNLVSALDQRTIRLALPTDCGLVVFDGLDEWATSGGTVHYGELADFFIELNRAGIAVVTVMPDSGKNLAVDLAALGIRKRNVIHLSRDSTSLNEFGATITIRRPKRGEDDPVPRSVQFSYSVIDGRFDFTWECRDPLSDETAKQIEIAERRKKVVELLPIMPQKDIAAFLGVTPSTISRDAGRIRTKAKKSPPAQTDSDYE